MKCFYLTLIYWISTISESEQGFLPVARLGRDVRYIRNLIQPLLKTNHRVHGRTLHENSMLRRNPEPSETAQRYFKKIQSQDKQRHLGESRYHDDNRYFDLLRFVNQREPLNKQLEKNFDENGMLFITEPKYDPNRKVNQLLNKIIAYKMDEDDERGTLRHHKLRDLFTGEDLEEMEKIVASRDESFRRSNKRKGIPKMPNVVYEFSDLVI